MMDDVGRFLAEVCSLGMPTYETQASTPTSVSPLGRTIDDDSAGLEYRIKRASGRTVNGLAQGCSGSALVYLRQKTLIGMYRSM